MTGVQTCALPIYSEIVKDRLLEFSKKFASEGDRPANHFTDKKELDNLQIYHGEKGLTDILVRIHPCVQFDVFAMGFCNSDA